MRPSLNGTAWTTHWPSTSRRHGTTWRHSVRRLRRRYGGTSSKWRSRPFSDLVQRAITVYGTRPPRFAQRGSFFAVKNNFRGCDMRHRLAVRNRVVINARGTPALSLPSVPRGYLRLRNPALRRRGSFLLRFWDRVGSVSALSFRK